MRTTQRDQTGTITFAASVSDAPSGTGVAQPGAVPFTFTRTATGTYVYQFDPRIRPLGVTATINSGNGQSASQMNQGAGTFTIVTGANNVAANGHHSWSCTANDKRT